jgi:hypothetical protein
LDSLLKALRERKVAFVGKSDLRCLEEAEKAEANRLGIHEFKFATNKEMLDVKCK